MRYTTVLGYFCNFSQKWRFFFVKILLGFTLTIIKTSNFCPKSQKMEPPKMVISQIELPMKSYELLNFVRYFLMKNKVDWLIFWIPQRVLRHDIRVRYSGKLGTICCENDQEFTIFVQNIEIIQSLKITFRSQIEPSNKS